MSVFTANELAYLAAQKVGRLATVDKDSNPHVVPVGFRYNAETDTIDIGGMHIADTQKWRNAGRHPRVSFVVDDVSPGWETRMIHMQADAERLAEGGKAFGDAWAPELLRLHIVKIVSYGLDGTRRSSRKVGED